MGFVKKNACVLDTLSENTEVKWHNVCGLF